MGKEKASISVDEQVEFVATHFNISLQALDTLKLKKSMKQHITTKEDIENTIKSFHLCTQSVQYNIASYKRGDRFTAVKGLNKWLHNRYSTSEYNKWVLKNRNEKWAMQFKKAYKNHDHIFIAAGTFHFIGPFNLIDMLRRDGFDIERISCQDSFHNGIFD